MVAFRLNRTVFARLAAAFGCEVANKLVLRETSLLRNTGGFGVIDRRLVGVWWAIIASPFFVQRLFKDRAGLTLFLGLASRAAMSAVGLVLAGGAVAAPTTFCFNIW